MIEIVKQLIKEYKDGSDEPLCGDEVDRLVEHVRNIINLNEGNISPMEYNNLENLQDINNI